MTKITGIIAEFNPFHNGHKHLLTQAQGLKIVVMSGNWVQHGEPAIFDKWIRAKMALENGADIVVELPTQISVQSADFFARGAVDILAELGCETLIFGSETTIDYNEISKNYAQNVQEMEAFIAALPDDFSYPEKTQRMWQHFSTVTFDGNTPNHVLGLAYAKACAKKQIQLQSIVRLGASHDSKILASTSSYASGSALRREILAAVSTDKLQKFMPSALDIPDGALNAVSWENYFPLLRYRIVSTSDLTCIFQVNEELSHRIKKSMNSAENFETLVDLVHTKRYTKARVRRVLTYILLGITPDFTLPKQIHVLGFNKKGQAHLRKVREKIIVRIGQKPWDKVTQNADEIYQLGHLAVTEQNFGRKPIIL